MTTTYDLSPYIDHTNLRPEATSSAIRTLCEEAVRYQFAAVCVNPHFVGLCAELVRGSNVRVATTIDFPLGAGDPETRAFSTTSAVRAGAHEIDFVINVGMLKERRTREILADFTDIIDAAGGATTKVILETCLLTDDEKRIACELASTAGVGFVKTSTGFGAAGATEHDVKLMRAASAPHVKIRASGGIRTREAALSFVECGADRLGTSAGIRIVEG
jgi:deoxyribose-phosphate aldolase